MTGWINPERETAAILARNKIGMQLVRVAKLRSTTRFRLYLCRQVSAPQLAEAVRHRARPAVAPSLRLETLLAQQPNLPKPTPAPAGPVSAPGGN